MAKNRKRYNTKQLTNHLREMAAEAHTMVDDGSILTRGEALAKLIFDKARGYTEKTVDDEGETKEVYHQPASWAIQLLWDRMEGKAPLAITEDDARVKVAEQVRELAKDRLNKLVPAASGPPSFDKEK